MNNEFNNQNPDSFNAQSVAQPVVQELVQPVVQPAPVVAPEPVMVQPQPVTPVVDQNVLATNTVQNQVPNGEVLEKPKKKKPIALIIILLLVLLAGAGVGAYFLFFNGNGSSPDKIAKKYIQNLINKKYDENYDLVYIEDNTFIEKNDYSEFAQTTQKYSDITSKTIEKVDEKLKTEKDASYMVNLVNKDKAKSTLEVNLKQVDGAWKVVESNFYITNWEFITAKGAVVTINGKEVPRTFIKEDTTLKSYKEKYSIPAITATKKAIVLKTNIGEYQTDFTPLGSNSQTEFKILLTDTDLANKAFNYIKETWNNIYKDYTNKVDVSEVKEKYFDSSVDINDINKYYTESMKSLTSSDNYNYQMIEVIPRDGKENYVFGDDLIYLNFGYKLTWKWALTKTYIWDKDMTRWSNIYLKVDGDSFKIYLVPDEKLFSWANQFNHDYKSN